MERRKVILVTDGDTAAKKAVESAAKNIGGRCISCSAGNPTILTGAEIVEHIKTAPYDPVVVMVDDCGGDSAGRGETAMETILNHPDIETLGVVAVASNGKDKGHIKVDCSFTKDGKRVEHAVDKYGNDTVASVIKGDTLSVLKNMNVPIIVGIGDPGKMDGKDDVILGAPITTAALKEILKVGSSSGLGGSEEKTNH
ncbi:MAG: stage V sporulation protein AE [Firmicutes bacterium]|nr:stage V sporulation protein AE [Bacillota bacterium]